MKFSRKSLAFGAAAFAALAIAAPSAWAGCAAEVGKTPAVFDMGAVGGATGAPQLIKAANPGHVADLLGGGRSSGIVGLWSIQLTSGSTVVDFGYTAWHPDGTEIMNSGGHPASTGNFCLGAWAQTGPLSYHLNHFALAYNPDNWKTPNGGLMARINLKEDIVLDRGGQSFSGAFVQDGYDPVTNAVIPSWHVAGRIVGHRVTAN